MSNVAQAEVRENAIDYLDKKSGYERYDGFDMSQVEYEAVISQ